MIFQMELGNNIFFPIQQGEKKSIVVDATKEVQKGDRVLVYKTKEGSVFGEHRRFLNNLDGECSKLEAETLSLEVTHVDTSMVKSGEVILSVRVVNE